MSRLRARLATLLCLIASAVIGTAGGAGVALAAPPKASLTDVEDSLMCTICHTPLAVAESPEANRERAYVRALIDRGETKPQILRAMVAQYGEKVLAKPPARGFNLVVYVLPPLGVLGAALALAFSLPRWRRRSRISRAALGGGGASALAAADAARLDADLARFDR